MIKVTNQVPRDEIRQAFFGGDLEIDATKASDKTKQELRVYLAKLKIEATSLNKKESEHGAKIRMQNNQIGQRHTAYQRLRVQRRLQPNSCG